MTTTYTADAVSPAAFAATGQQAAAKLASTDPVLNGREAPIVTTIPAGSDVPVGVAADQTLVAVAGTPRAGFTWAAGAAGIIGALTGVIDALLGTLNIRTLNSGADSVTVAGAVVVSGAVSTATGASVAFTSPPTALTANTDTVFTFASQVKHVYLENKSTTDAYFNLDAAASLGTFWLPANGGIRGLDVPCAALHLFSVAPTPVNGGTSTNLVVRGWA